jgi:hypothetical protein
VFLLSIDKETDELIELAVQSGTHLAVGCALADKQGIFYTLTSGKGGIPISLMETVSIVQNEEGKYVVEIHTKADEQWNRGVRKNHPVLYWLNLVKKSERGKVLLGYFPIQTEANRFELFLKKLGYPI